MERTALHKERDRARLVQRGRRDREIAELGCG